MNRSSRVVAVFGATGAIGSAVALRFAEMRYTVVGLARHPERLEVLAAESASQGQAIHTLPLDVCGERALRDGFDWMARRVGTPHSIVYAAGLTPDVEVPLARYPIRDWHRTLGVYITGFLVVFQEALARFSPGGHLLVLSSAVTRFSGDRLPPIFCGHYAASKAGLDQLVRWGRREAHEKGLLLSSLAPGAVDCPYHRASPAQFQPSALLPMDTVVERITSAIDQGTEIDEQLVAAAQESRP